MNYQLLIESYSFGTTLNEQEINLLTLELETQIMNLSINLDIPCLNPAPEYVCRGLNLRKGTYWISCLAEVIDRYNYPNSGKTKGAEVFDELLKRGLVIG
tara:strand:- start:4067 stop:4366 length:300 start_codon:yes stop_codon:yes gene_type:complete